MDRKEFEALIKLLDYVSYDEKQNFEEGDFSDNNHIWNHIKVLIDYAQAHQFTLQNLEEELASEPQSKGDLPF